MSIDLRQAAEQAITAILACIDYIPDNTSQGDKDATAAEEAVKALRAALSQQPAAPNVDVRTILLAIVPGDGNGEEVYAESVDDVVAKMTELYEHEESLRTQVDLLTAAVEARGREIAKLKATGEPVQADSSEHLRVIASLGDALRRLSFAAQTTGGTAGPDAELQSAIGQAEQALSLGGIWQAMSATGEPVEDGIRNAEDELNCAEELLDAITCEFSDGEFPVTDFNCIGDYITAVVDVFKERLAAQQPATGEPSKDEAKRLIDTLRTDASGGRAATVHELDAAADLIEASLSAAGEPVDFIVSAVLIKKTPDGLFSTQNKLYAVEAASREEAHGKVLPLLGVDFPEHQLHTFCSRPVPSVPATGEPVGEVLSGLVGDIGVEVKWLVHGGRPLERGDKLYAQVR